MLSDVEMLIIRAWRSNPMKIQPTVGPIESRSYWQAASHAESGARDVGPSKVAQMKSDTILPAPLR